MPTSTPSTDTSSAEALIELVTHTLDEGKAEEIVLIDLVGKTSFADAMIVASGRSARQVSALASQVTDKLKSAGHGRASVEGAEHGDWVLIDAGDLIVHLFRPEVRAYYNLEKMWAAPPIPETSEARIA